MEWSHTNVKVTDRWDTTKNIEIIFLSYMFILVLYAKRLTDRHDPSVGMYWTLVDLKIQDTTKK